MLGKRISHVWEKVFPRVGKVSSTRCHRSSNLRYRHRTQVCGRHHTQERALPLGPADQGKWASAVRCNGNTESESRRFCRDVRATLSPARMSHPSGVSSCHKPGARACSRQNRRTIRHYGQQGARTHGESGRQEPPQQPACADRWQRADSPTGNK